MGRRKTQPGEIGSISWERRGDAERGRARAVDGGGATHRLSATGYDRESIAEDLRRQAAELLYLNEAWTGSTTVERIVAGWLQERREAGAASAAQFSFDYDEDEKDRGTVRPQTIDRYDAVLSSVIGPRLGSIPVGELRAKQIKGFMKDLEKAKYSDSYRKMTLFVLEAALDFAITEECIEQNPARPIARVTVKRKKAIALDAAQVDALRGAIHTWTHAPRRSGPKRSRNIELFTEIALATGMRIGEILAIRPADIDLTSIPATVAVTGTVVSFKGTDGKWKLIRQDYPKQRRQRRRLRLPAFGRAALIEAIGQMVDPKDREATVLQARGGGLISPNNFRRSFRTLVEQTEQTLLDAGIRTSKLTPHILRKTVLTAVTKASGDIELARAQGGHEKSDITKRYYIEKKGDIPIVEGVASIIEESLSPSPQAA